MHRMMSLDHGPRWVDEVTEAVTALGDPADDRRTEDMSVR
jgi:hypothetical protein